MDKVQTDESKEHKRVQGTQKISKRRKREELKELAGLSDSWSTAAKAGMLKVANELIREYNGTGEIKLQGWMKNHLKKYNDYGCNLEKTTMASVIVLYVIKQVKDAYVLREVLKSGTKALMNMLSDRLGLGQIKNYERYTRAEIISQIAGLYESKENEDEVRETSGESSKTQEETTMIKEATVKELRARAKELGVKGYIGMTKNELWDAVARAKSWAIALKVSGAYHPLCRLSHRNSDRYQRSAYLPHSIPRSSSTYLSLLLQFRSSLLIPLLHGTSVCNCSLAFIPFYVRYYCVRYFKQRFC